MVKGLGFEPRLSGPKPEVLTKLYDPSTSEINLKPLNNYRLTLSSQFLCRI